MRVVLLLFSATLCVTLLVGTVGVAYHGPSVAREVTLALIAAWLTVAKIVLEILKKGDSNEGA